MSRYDQNFDTEKYSYEDEKKFKQDAIKNVGLDGHPKAERIYEYAYNEGHACGYHEIYIHLSNLAELILDD